MTAIKVCGITNVKDALMCAELGVDLIGINFCSQSPRFVDVREAETIINKTKKEFPRVETVGVFQNEQEEKLIRICQKTGIDLIQLHGDESKSYQINVRDKTGKQLIKAVRLKDDCSFTNLRNISADYILLDSFHPKKYGGTGIPLDNTLALKAMRSLKGKRVILAGGINQSNVKEFLELNPFAIDINSGVEASIGKKDSNKIRSIVSIIKGELK
jgi:phosphoribosylanthranilate isomerase